MRFFLQISLCLALLWGLTAPKARALRLQCPRDMVVHAPMGRCDAEVRFAIPLAVGNTEEGVSIRQVRGLESGDRFPLGKTTIAFRASNPAGELAECEFTVEVQDREPPRLDCPVSDAENLVTRSKTPQLGFLEASATDNCGGVEIERELGPPKRSYMGFRRARVSFTATDNAGNISECTFFVAMGKEGPLKLQCPPDVEIASEPGACHAPRDFVPPLPETRLPGFTLETPSGPKKGADFAVGVTLLSYHATGKADQHAECSFKVRVVDQEKPRLECPADLSVQAAAGQKEAVVNYLEPIVSDNCGSPDLRRNSGFKSGEPFPLGKTEVSYTAMDLSGNFESCSFQVEVRE